MHSHLATDAAAFVAAKGRFCMHAVTGIDGDHARAHAPGSADTASEVARPHRPGKSIGGIIGDAQRLFFTVEWHHTHHRPENLVLGHAHSVFDIGQDSRLQVLAVFAAGAGRHASSSANQRRAFLLAERDVIERTLALPGGNHGAKFGLLAERITDL